MKLKNIKRSLNQISQTNDIALKTSILKESILTSESKDWNEEAESPFSYSKLDSVLDFHKNYKNVKKITLTATNSFIVKIKVKGDQLLKKLETVKTKFASIDDLLLLSYASFNFFSKEDEKLYKNLLNCLFLVRNNYLVSSPVLISKIITTNIEENQYNQKSLEHWNNKANKTGKDACKYYNKKNELEREIEKSTKFISGIDQNKIIQKTAAELLFKGDHTLKICFYQFTSEITKEGHNIMKTNWWKINWYLVFCFLSLFSSFTILAFYITNFFIIGHL